MHHQLQQPTILGVLLFSTDVKQQTEAKLNINFKSFAQGQDST